MHRGAIHDAATGLTAQIGDWDEALARFRAGTDRAVLLNESRARRIADRHPEQVVPVLESATRTLAGEYTYFGYPRALLGEHVDWNYDAIADFHWPRCPSNQINHRTADADPKWIWELNRLQHLPLLAEAWLFTGDEHYADAALAQIDSWIEQNPPGVGIAWRGAFEVGIRAISLAVALQGLCTAPGLTTTRFQRLAHVLDISARYCWHDRSLYSSANNHLVGELTGLLTTHLILPELATPARFFNRALDRLAVEADRQILPDGAGAEQSISYQMFTTELIALVATLLRSSGTPIPAALTAALCRDADHLAAMVGSDDPDPRYGDDDDSFALRLGPESKRTVRQHLGIVSALTEHRAIRYGSPTITASWIADAVDNELDGLGAGIGSGEIESSHYADKAGLVVLRRGRNRLTMDVGALGYLSIAAHGHADALAVTLSCDGHDVIVDPGTASYYGHPDWRAVHRGTRAHPTVCVDNTDQSQIGGPFYWRRHARISSVSVDLAAGVVDAAHDGYLRLDSPVSHRRWLIAAPGDSTVAVVDLLDSRGTHNVDLIWPLHPDMKPTPVTDTGSGHLIDRGGVLVLQMSYAATVPFDLVQVCGDSNSQHGWWSDRLEHRIPAWWVGTHINATGPVALMTLLRIPEDDAVITSAQIRMDRRLLLAQWIDNGTARRLHIDTSSLAAVLTESGPPQRI